MIKKQGGKFQVKDKMGKKTLGTHKTKTSALEQLAAIEINKKSKPNPKVIAKAAKMAKPASVYKKASKLSAKPMKTKFSSKGMEY